MIRVIKGLTSVLIAGILIAVAVFWAGSFHSSNQTTEDIKEKKDKTTDESQDIFGNIQDIEESGRHKDVPESVMPDNKMSFSDKPQTTSNSDIVQGYPVNCYPRLGFDNYRTEKTFVINPKNNKEMYINVEYKGLYKSIDGGNAWVFSGKGLKGLPKNDDSSKPCHELRFHLYIDSSNPDRLLAPGGSAPGRVGEGLGGLSESLDRGATWRQLFTSEMSAYTESVIIDPTNTAIVYVTTSSMPQGMDGPDKGKMFVSKGVLYKTINGGKTWEELPTGFFENLRVPGIFIDAQNPKKLRLATFGLPSGTNIDKKTTKEQWGFLETNDSGRTWIKMDSTIGIGIRNLDVSPSNLNHFYLMASKDNTDKVYYSVDGTLKEPSNMMVNFARYDPHDKNGMRLIGINIHAQPNDLFESLDGGKTWSVVGKLPRGVTNDHRVSNIVFDPVDNGVIYINADQARVWKSNDKGNTWEMLLSLDKLKGL